MVMIEVRMQKAQCQYSHSPINNIKCNLERVELKVLRSGGESEINDIVKPAGSKTELMTVEHMGAVLE